MAEIDELLCKLENVALRPGMYGNPEIAESTAMNLAHVVFRIVNKEWRWASTQRIWENAAAQLGYGQKFTSEYYESDSYRYGRWGDLESEARLQIHAIYLRIWDQLSADSKSYGATSGWINYLLETPCLLGSPDNLDIVMWCLMNLATSEKNNRFKELYDKECNALRGFANYGLRNLFVNPEFSYTSVSSSHNNENYTRVTIGIHLILQNIAKKSTSLDC